MREFGRHLRNAIKHDGFRAIAFIADGGCRLVSRNGNEFKSFGVLAAEICEQLDAAAAVLDGEIVCLDHRGRSHFNDLLFRRGDPGSSKARFFAFSR